jgi:predicted PurR-regulated permease PerM
MQGHAAVAGNETRNVRVRFVTLLKIALFALLVVCVIKLWSVILMFTVGVLLAVMLDPLVALMVRHGFRRGAAIGTITFALFALLAVFLTIVVPLTVSQIRQIATDLPRLSQRLSSSFPAARPVIDSIANAVRESPRTANVRQWLTRGLTAGVYAIQAFIAVVLVFVFAIYLLVEGQQMFEWLLAFVPADKRQRVRRTAHEARGVVVAYMRGQSITCFLCGTVALTTLLILHVPAAVPMAVLAFLFDLMPVIGTIVMTAPAVALALLVSPFAAVVVLIVYLAYHLIESYVIIPRVWGKQMRLSTLTVLLAVTVGAVLQGPIGVVLTLLAAAIYPIVERIWLREKLPEDTVEKHGDRPSS